MSDNDIKLCIDCAHSNNTPYDYHECRRFTEDLVQQKSLVDGSTPRQYFTICDVERSDSGLFANLWPFNKFISAKCGPEAKYFTPKKEHVPPTQTGSGQYRHTSFTEKS